MTLKQKEALIICTICGLGFIAAVISVLPYLGREAVVDKEVHFVIPTKAELQQALIDAGYYCGAKGADGVIRELTLNAWEMYECDKAAAEVFEQAGAE